MATNNAPEVKPAPAPFDAAVFGATVQLPAFDKVEPETWFTSHHADTNFALGKVTDSATKYYYVLSKLDAFTLRKLSAFLKCNRGPDPYQEIRRQLCCTYEPRLEQKLETLLAIKDMGDERPMEFALEPQRLSSDATMDDVLKRIFSGPCPLESRLRSRPVARPNSRPWQRPQITLGHPRQPWRVRPQF